MLTFGSSAVCSCGMDEHCASSSVWYPRLSPSGCASGATTIIWSRSRS